MDDGIVNTLTEENLIASYKESGDLKFLGQLYEPYQPLVYGLCLKYFKNSMEAEDAAMDIFEKLIVKLKTHNVSNFKSWLYTVTKNHCFEKLRKKQRVMEKEFDAGIMYSEGIFHLDKKEEKEIELNQLDQCLENLPEKQKQCIQLFFYESKTYKEISEGLELSWSQVRSFIQNGRRNLKICMESNG